ncbi:MAG TPA: hypothetical protein VN706_11180 [Gemmatimonadaceae bacterium]|nr:hypothetical protein [Gemmatimonadaceae bacterium]
MTHDSLSVLATRLSRRIAWRLRLARWGKLLVLPTFVAAFYAGRWNERAALLGFGLFLLEVLAIMLGEAQRCPLCEASLVIGRGPQEEFVGTCPDCGYPID